MVARAAFSWWPKPDVWPLFASVFAAVGFCGYSSFRCITTNPDVHLKNSHRTCGAAEEGTTLKRAQGYYNSFYRSTAARRKTEDPNAIADVRIFQ